MLEMLITCIGLICIVFSIMYIYFFSKKEKDIYDELIYIYNNIRDYYVAIESTVSDFEQLIDSSLDKLEYYEKKVSSNNLDRNESFNRLNSKRVENPIIIDSKLKTKKSISEFDKNILELKNKGYSFEEIAKKLNMGIREVEIIIKLQEKLYKIK
ncbi:hypothetical protein EDD65_105161 [Keratinibaculum paraultunense]|uniref:Uncharacterized protein n=1 Tax=Keratinibaculum paraultunense TaxID=1278232 RepID=A0A4R3KVZ4_9FIRM|nr:hypothetical protein [Keratinibaculum paraultunense]QQY80708.1 hypothetical protein JL105_05275 [Keratinibaculum paraultunense]TCS89687.1 hypothetical protein EDD65_105161 [Keratinibaculum paraultunense]